VSDHTLPELDPVAPRSPQNARRRLCAWILRRMGWRMTGEFPRLPKVVIIVAPHSSWWDGVVALLIKVAVGLDASFMAKKELFFPPLGWLLRRLGGVPIERSASHGVVEQMVERFGKSERMWLALAAEGTRKPVKKWKTGFWHIAREAGVPILMLYFHYPEKVFGIGPVYETTADMEADMRNIREFYRPWMGANRGTLPPE
jgi:1-acyl-sn-glycerol-3-phosphate acyltransferase